MEKFYEKIISLIKLVIQLISYMMTSIITIPLQSEVMSLGKSQHLDLLSVVCHGILDLFIFTYTFEMIVHVFPLFCIYS